MLKVMKEVTKWEVDYREPNHTYLMQGDKMIAYKVYHDGELRLAHGHRMDTRRRKFIEEPYVDSEWPLVPIEESKPSAAVITVEGSKGNTYEVDTEAETCTCPGFKFRGSCKHVKELIG